MFKCFYCQKGFWYICLKCLHSKNFTVILDIFIKKTIKELILLNKRYDFECLKLIDSIIKILKPYILHQNFLFQYVPKQKPSKVLLKEALQGLILTFEDKHIMLFEHNLHSITELYNTCELMYVLNKSQFID